MEGKKISFGFMKTKKAEKPIIEERKDFIECVEEKSIKVIGGDEIKENTPLIIPMKPNTLVTAERLKQIAEKVESALDEPEPELTTEKSSSPPEKAPENETLEQMAVRELLQDVKKKEANTESPILTVPLPAKPVNEGEKESTLDDYESVPVQDFGLAMLRGMGWTPGSEKSSYKQPQLRPKGLGLGADKVVKGNQTQKPAKDSKGDDLAIVKDAFVKITTGKYTGYYGKVLSLDEDNGRVMVDIAVKKETVSLSEFMMQPVTKSEFDKESKVINAGSYEDYKKMEAKKPSSNEGETKSVRSNKEMSYKEDIHLERESSSSKSIKKYERGERSTKNSEDYKSSKNGKDYKDEERRERERDRSHRSRRDAEENYSRKRDKRYSSNDSLESLSDHEKPRSKKKETRKHSTDSSSESDRERNKKNKKKDRKRHDSSDSESDYKSKRHKTPEGKRDIDKKRKGKKKKRDRDRSPNYRKHRK